MGTTTAIAEKAAHLNFMIDWFTGDEIIEITLIVFMDNASALGITRGTLHDFRAKLNHSLIKKLF